MGLTRWRLRAQWSAYDIMRFGDGTWWLHGPLDSSPILQVGFWRIRPPRPWPPTEGDRVFVDWLDLPAREILPWSPRRPTMPIEVERVDVFILRLGPVAPLELGQPEESSVTRGRRMC